MKNFKRLLLYLTLLLLFILAILLITNNLSPEIPNTSSVSSFIDLENFNLQEFLSSLSRLELFAFISLCFNSLILNAIISIVFIFYGDILIKYFNLEVRFPKLAKFISIRRKLNNYALKYNLFLILFSVGSQMFASLLIFWQYINF